MSDQPAKGPEGYAVVQLDLQREPGHAMAATEVLPSLEEVQSSATTAPHRIDAPATDEGDELQRPWQVVVWNDPVNLMSYVVYVFRKLFGFPEEEATRLMLAVHHDRQPRGGSPCTVTPLPVAWWWLRNCTTLGVFDDG